MFVSPAYAQAAAPGGQGLLEFLLPIALIFIVFYFLLIRPQQRKQRDHKALVDAVRRGDRVITGGGLVGKVIKVTEAEGELPRVTLEVAKEVRVEVIRSTLADVISKPNPADAAGRKADKDDSGWNKR